MLFRRRKTTLAFSQARKWEQASVSPARAMLFTIEEVSSIAVAHRGLACGTQPGATTIRTGDSAAEFAAGGGSQVGVHNNFLGHRHSFDSSWGLILCAASDAACCPLSY